MRFITIVFIFFIACGETIVQVDEQQYAPKIVVDGYLFPGRPVQNIRIMRNYPLNTEIDLNDIFLSNARVSCMDVAAGKNYPLVFRASEYAYTSADSRPVVEYGKVYRLDVQAEIDGENLSTSCTSQVPQKGFYIDREASILGEKIYRQKNKRGEVEKFRLAFKRSPDVDTYICSIIAMNASVFTFIEDNSLGLKWQDVQERNILMNLKYRSQRMITGQDKLAYMDINWMNIWYYGDYRVILYAADENFADFVLSYRNVRDIDGNLWEPKFHFEGDGIGVFGAAIADTVYFRVNR
ncbi:DUF4249 family protein [candidate division KSB1 bacterium]|nr:DUF4249 family protein [candidate division KSB1 bacterium]